MYWPGAIGPMLVSSPVLLMMGKSYRSLSVTYRRGSDQRHPFSNVLKRNNAYNDKMSIYIDIMLTLIK